MRDHTLPGFETVSRLTTVAKQVQRFQTIRAIAETASNISTRSLPSNLSPKLAMTRCHDVGHWVSTICGSEPAQCPYGGPNDAPFPQLPESSHLRWFAGLVIFVSLFVSNYV
jgi:hypothetical protein